MEPSFPVPPLPPEPALLAPLATGPTQPRHNPRRTPSRRGLGLFVRNNVVMVIVVIAVLGVGGTALALGAPSRPSLDLTSSPLSPGVSTPAPPGGPAAPADAPPVPTPANATTNATPPPGPGRSRPRLATGHGTMTIQTAKGPRTVTFDRGTVAGLTYGAIVVAHPDGSTATLSLTGATRFGPKGRQARVGDVVLVLSTGGRALSVTSRA